MLRYIDLVVYALAGFLLILCLRSRPFNRQTYILAAIMALLFAGGRFAVSYVGRLGALKQFIKGNSHNSHHSSIKIS